MILAAAVPAHTAYVIFRLLSRFVPWWWLLSGLVVLAVTVPIGLALMDAQDRKRRSAHKRPRVYSYPHLVERDDDRR